MTDALARRESLRGLFLVVDCRRGVLPGDEGLMDWASDAGRPIHVLLTKSDKLKRAELAKTLAAAKRALGERASVQMFSAEDATGLDEARRQLNFFLK
jgi:GTP-binding protein